MPFRSLAKYPRSKATCTVYLLHFSKPLGHAQHYIGVTALADVEQRLELHRQGRGARICAKAVEAGAELLLARVWEGVPRYTELKLKNRGGARRLCPLCKLGTTSSGHSPLTPIDVRSDTTCT